jgi:signal transduction histidine kinase
MENGAISAAQLRALAEWLVSNEQAIMRAWRDSARSDPELSTPRSLSRSRFDDHIPGLLRAFAAQLRAWPGAGIVDAEAVQEQRGAQHGAHRWQEGYSLPEVAREWVHLHLVLLDLFEQHALREAPDPETMVVARRLLAMLCGQGVSRSVSEYVRLMQAQAAGRVRDLEAAVASLNELQRQRSGAWREAAHDLRNTVGVVTYATGILKRKDAPDPVRAKSLAALQNGVTSLANTLHDLLDLARVEAGLEQRNITDLDAGVLMHEICERARELAAERGLFVQAQGPSSLQIQGDEQKIRRIAHNLLNNALRYASQGGVIVRWDRSDQEGSRHWTLSLDDVGAVSQGGAAAEVVNELKQVRHGERLGSVPAPGSAPPSQRAQGEGIALSLVKHLCELLDATLEFPPHAAGGSSVLVQFPSSYELP